MLSAEKNELLIRVGPGTPMGNLLRRYWMPIGGASELDLKAIERALGPMTLRTMGTIEQMAGKHFSD